MTETQIRETVIKGTLLLVRAALGDSQQTIDASVKLVRATNVVLDQNYERMLYAILTGKKLPPAIKGKKNASANRD